MKISAPTPTQRLIIRVRYLEEENLKLNQQIAYQVKELTILRHFANAPPTVMIACEKLVEAATQLTTNANNLIDRMGRIKC